MIMSDQIIAFLNKYFFLYQKYHTFCVWKSCKDNNTESITIDKGYNNNYKTTIEISYYHPPLFVKYRHFIEIKRYNQSEGCYTTMFEGYVTTIDELKKIFIMIGITLDDFQWKELTPEDKRLEIQVDGQLTKNEKK